MPADEHDDTPSYKDPLPEWARVCADAVIREIKAADEHHMDLWHPGWRDEERDA